MKRDWDLIRKQLTYVEEEKDLFSELVAEPISKDQDWAAYENEVKECKAIEERILGHLELLVDAGYIDGVRIVRTTDGQLHYSVHCPRLTMAGHDLLDTMRSKTIWEKIKVAAKEKGVELTFDTIKALAEIVVKGVLR